MWSRAVYSPVVCQAVTIRLAVYLSRRSPQVSGMIPGTLVDDFSHVQRLPVDPIVGTGLGLIRH